MSEQAAVNADPFKKYDGPPRTEVLGGSVSAEEKATALAALAEGGFANMSEGVREVCLAYRDSAEVRRVIHEHIDVQRRAA